MIKGKVTSKTLRGMEDGEVLVFEVPRAEDIYSGRALAYRLQNILGCGFVTRADFPKLQLSITRIQKTT